MDSTPRRSMPSRRCRNRASCYELDFQEEVIIEGSSEEEQEKKDNGDNDKEGGGSSSEEGSEDENEMEVDSSSASEDESDSEEGGDGSDFEEVLESQTGTPRLTLKKAKQIKILQNQRSLPASPASTSFASTSMESYNPESYLLADNRLTFKTVRSKEDEIPNDARRGRKPRKGTRGTGGQKTDNRPERLQSYFSVTKEGIRAAGERLGKVEYDDSKHGKELQRLLEEKIQPDFPRWMSYLRKGFNLALHGFGSKIAVVDCFHDYLDSEGLSAFQINGLHPRINARLVIAELVEKMQLPATLRGSSMDTVSEDLCNQLMKIQYAPVFILITNFDVMALNSPILVTAICNLAKIKWIHILATTDNVNAGLGITQSQSIQLNFCWIQCSTFESYSTEFNWLPNIFGDSNATKGTENTLQYVLKSLTGNARKAFAILASLQLNKMKNTQGKKGAEVIGVEFSELARKCKENFVAHNDSVLRTLLVEFVDHKLITRYQGKRKGSGNLLTIDLELAVLEKIVNDGFQS